MIHFDRFWCLLKHFDTIWWSLTRFDAFCTNWFVLAQYFNIFYFFKQARYPIFWEWHVLFFSIWWVLIRFDRFQRFWHVMTHINIFFSFFSNRQDIQCFGDDTCYSLAFGVPAVLMLIATVILVIGKNLWIKGLLKVRKSQKLFFMASNVPKNQWFFPLISALASKILTIKFLNLNVIIFWPKKVNTDIFLTFMLIYILVQTLEYTQSPAFYLFFPCK